jgi:acyl carrier protein
MDVELQIRQFIAQNMLFSDDEFHYEGDVSLLREGIIDSLGVMELVTFVSTTFGITVEPQEVTADNFDSVNNLAAFVRRKLSTATSASAV